MTALPPDSDSDFAALIGPVTLLKDRGARVKTERTRPLEIRLRQTADDRVAHAVRKQPIALQASSRVIDGATAKRLKQGKIRPEQRLDLHGFTHDAARTALRRFVVDAAATGHRCVLVVTGKGEIGGAEDGAKIRGVIKRAFPTWLTQSPLNALVLKAKPAKPEDGGSGAFYLYLRRDRSKTTYD